MDLITFAIAVALLELVVGISLLLAPVRSMDRVCELLDDTALLRVIMFGFLTVSITAVVRDGAFEGGVRELLTWIAIFSSVKALLYIWFPQFMVSLRSRFLDRDRRWCTRGLGLIMMVCFVFFSWTVRELLRV